MLIIKASKLAQGLIDHDCMFLCFALERITNGFYCGSDAMYQAFSEAYPEAFLTPPQREWHGWTSEFPSWVVPEIEKAAGANHEQDETQYRIKIINYLVSRWGDLELKFPQTENEWDGSTQEKFLLL